MYFVEIRECAVMSKHLSHTLQVDIAEIPQLMKREDLTGWSDAGLTCFSALAGLSFRRF